jgi:predicted transcriptional regulator of viral defense system
MPDEGSRRDRRRRLLALAYSQAGYFSASQAHELGFSYQAQKYHVDTHNWVRTERGIYRLPEWLDGPWDSLVRWTLWSGGRGVVSHETALAVHDLSDVDPAQVHLTVPSGFGARHQGVVLHHDVLAATDVERREGYSITSPVRTLLDVAAGDLSQEHVDNAVHEAAERGLISVRRMRNRADEAGDRAALRIERALATRS